MARSLWGLTLNALRIREFLHGNGSFHECREKCIHGS